MDRDGGRWGYSRERRSLSPYRDPFAVGTQISRSSHYRMSPPRRERSPPVYDSIFDLPSERFDTIFDSPDEDDYAPPRKAMRADLPMGGPRPLSGYRGRPTIPDDRMPLKKMTTRCSFFLEGRCEKGRDCRFSHDMTVCRFYQKGTCTKGKACPFMHTIKKPFPKKRTPPPSSRNGPTTKTSVKTTKTTTPSKTASKKSPAKSPAKSTPKEDKDDKSEATSDTSLEKSKPEEEEVKTVMRAIRVARFGCPTVMEVVKDFAIPEPSSTQVLIKVGAAGVNPVDTYIRTGAYAKLPTLPYTPGNDAAGTIEKVGDDVTQFKKGDHVYTVRTVSGAYAEYAVADVEHTFLLDDLLTYQQGAGIGVPYFTAYKALFLRGQAKPGETVLVHGASGGVGLAACQAARAHGLHVIGTAGSTPGIGLVKENGASSAFYHTDKDYAKKIMTATNDKGVDLIIEMRANVNLERDLGMLTTNGRIMIVGSRGKIEIDPRVVMEKEADIRGVMFLNTTPAEFKLIGAALHAGQEAGWVQPVVGNEFALTEAADAHTEIGRANHTSEGKMVISL